VVSADTTPCKAVRFAKFWKMQTTPAAFAADGVAKLTSLPTRCMRPLSGFTMPRASLGWHAICDADKLRAGARARDMM
jgi:hypothetical protein